MHTINERSSKHYIEIFLADIRSNGVGAAPATARELRNAESCAARGLTAAALELYLGSQPLPEVLAGEVRPENGKPCFPDYPDFHYNISHSGGIVVCAVSDSPVGIDVQQISDDPAKILKIAGHFFSKEEQQELSLLHQEKKPDAGSGCDSCSNGEQDLCRLFCRYWTARESYIKLTGRGLAEPFSDFRPDLTAGRIITASPTVDNYYLTECPAPEGYCMTVCSTAPVNISEVTIHK